MKETVLTQAINLWDSRIEHYSKCKDLPPKFMDMLNEERLLLISLLPKEREQMIEIGKGVIENYPVCTPEDIFNYRFTQYKPKEDGK